MLLLSLALLACRADEASDLLVYDEAVEIVAEEGSCADGVRWGEAIVEVEARRSVTVWAETLFNDTSPDTWEIGFDCSEDRCSMELDRGDVVALPVIAAWWCEDGSEAGRRLYLHAERRENIVSGAVLASAVAP